MSCKYILGKKYKLQSNKFKNLFDYEERYIDSKQNLNKILDYYINLVLDINNKAIKLIIIYYEDYIFFVFKYPNVRMDEVSFFKVLDKISVPQEESYHLNFSISSEVFNLPFSLPLYLNT